MDGERGMDGKDKKQQRGVAFLDLVDIELDIELIVTATLEGIGLVNLGALGQFTVGLQVSGLLSVVLENDISLVVLEITEGNQDDISLVDPDLDRTKKRVGGQSNAISVCHCWIWGSSVVVPGKVKFCFPAVVEKRDVSCRACHDFQSCVPVSSEVQLHPQDDAQTMTSVYFCPWSWKKRAMDGCGKGHFFPSSFLQ